MFPGVSVIDGANIACTTVGLVGDALMPAGTATVAVPITVPSKVLDLMWTVRLMAGLDPVPERNKSTASSLLTAGTNPCATPPVALMPSPNAKPLS